MKDILLKYEKDLFKKCKVTNREWLDSVLSPNFKELGSSGNLLSREVVFNYLLNLKEDRDITIYNFECELIMNHCWIVHYITKINDVLSYRTSIWIAEERCKLIFHQASKINYIDSLVEY